MTTPAENALHARRRARTLRRAGGRTVAVLGFAALSWAAFTGTAMAQDSSDQPADGAPRQASGPASGQARIGDAFGSLTDDALRGLTEAADAVAPKTVAPETVAPEPLSSESVSPAAASDPTAAQNPSSVVVESVETTTTQKPPAPAGSLGDAGLIGSTVHGLTTYAVPQSSSAQPADGPATDTQAASVQGSPGGLSLPGLVGGAEDTVNGLTGSVLTATQLDKALPEPEVKLLSSTLDSLDVSSALPTVALPPLPVIEEPVNDVLGALPVDTTGIDPVLDPVLGPVLTDPSGSPVTTVPAPGTGTDVPSSPSPVAVSPSDPSTIDAFPAVPILLPFKTFPGSTDSPATFASLADAGSEGTGQDDVYLSRALLDTRGADAGDSSIPAPPGPHSPAGGNDGGSGSSHQQSGRLTSFTLPGGGFVSLVRDYGWHLPATPTFDPGFSPD
ncbi:hypothetical protein G5C66_23785 [Nocardioides sp. KC13]|uniref:Uncharacterized protein n=1 Tax=Nocardioides turkmenicus TaxID=2711220 RepID=A0A6M1R6J9_9ACTN|nr:hypothetical protein [Nocardioides sp. KC13]NGN95746.1 hypothetical protein [Nocardioides sp. KC13]